MTPDTSTEAVKKLAALILESRPYSRRAYKMQATAEALAAERDALKAENERMRLVLKTISRRSASEVGCYHSNLASIAEARAALEATDE